MSEIVARELRKLEMLVKYANKIVQESGISDQKSRGKLSSKTDASEYFKQLLETTAIYPDFDGNTGVSFSVRNSLYKRFYQYGNALEYITLLDAVDDDVCPDYHWYEQKSELAACGAVIALKKQVRGMIKNPDKYWRSS